MHYNTTAPHLELDVLGLFWIRVFKTNDAVNHDGESHDILYLYSDRTRWKNDHCFFNT